jgi:ATP-binding cassette subfamily C protein
VAFLLYIYYLVPPVQAVAGSFSQYQHGAAAIRRIQEVDLLPMEPVVDSEPEQDGECALPRAIGVAFENVSFRYAPELPPVLDEVAFAIPALGMTALVGPSGAGKTTTFSLIERFYDPDAGRVLLDGKDIAAWSLRDLRAAIGYVEQDAPVLSGTLRENLAYGAPGTGDADLVEVLETTRLTAHVDALPEGLETTVGHRGMKLSGGERQRVAIARALLRRPRLLLLDEATSQLDALNEAALRETIAAVAATTTVLVVAHRLSTITMADRILVLNAGRLQAVGTHRELLAKDALYAELATTQFLAGAIPERSGGR